LSFYQNRRRNKKQYESKVKRRENIEAHDIRSDALFYI